MITDSRITDYINSLDPGDGELCDGIAREAVRSRVPSSGGRRRLL